ncbi:WD40 repeat domain-containing protein [Phanerochaete sordida]|uniref:WD40 repeat domain-containing protein n=1 Tax=Phanerochaete sordida TaxID=48140 RepID=A0A9P3GHL1_9APHY|nr:WD40 repeat domain-containing protein [Phanerochaete sordida]
MASKTLTGSSHKGGANALAFSRDGSHIYTGGQDRLARVWKAGGGTDQQDIPVLDAGEAVTAVAAGNDCWFSGSKDSEVRHYEEGTDTLVGHVTSAISIPIRSLAVDPKGEWIAVASDEMAVKVVHINDTLRVKVLKGHTKGVRRVTWHPSGSLLTSCGADGRILVWDVSEDEAKQVTAIDGVIPAVSDSELPEYGYDCSAVWHTSGQHFYVATRTHELVTISRTDWTKSATFSDDACSGAITALAMSPNGVYVATASKSGVFVWATQNRRLMYRFQDSVTAPLTQLAWSPTANLLAWTDTDGALTRWQNAVPADGIDPVKLSASLAAAKPLPQATKRKETDLFDLDLEIPDADEIAADPDADMDEAGAGVADVPDDDWILDDIGGGMDDEDEATKDARWSGGGGVREMVSVTKAQPAFQPGATPFAAKKRYLAYNMLGVVEVTDQDTHHIVNVEFHDRSARKSYHFTDHFKYDLAALGERGAAFACPPEGAQGAHVAYKPYGAWAAQADWTYELPAGVRAVGVAAGGVRPQKSLRSANDADLEGHGNVVVATSDGELIFLSGGGVERHVMSLQGEFVAMVAGAEWVFVVQREGSTTMDGSQNLTGRLITFDDFTLLQKDTLPIPKHHKLTWIGITEEGAPAMYDSSGVLNILPRFRLPFQATWARILNTNTLERKEGKQESYWPVGVSGETFMCLILKGMQEHPGFPRPLIQELPIRLPFKRTDPKEGPLEEHFARETMLLNILRDELSDDELTTDAISARELALDKELIQLIQGACKADRLARALDLARLLHHPTSLDMAAKVAGFYHLVGLQEKIGLLRDARDAGDRLEDMRDARRARAADFAVVGRPRTVVVEREERRAKPFADFRPPPAVHRPGLERATATPAPDAGPARARAGERRETRDFQANAVLSDDEYAAASPDGKRKRSEEPPAHAKRRATDVPAAQAQAKANPFARKADTNKNPFTKGAEMNRSLHKSESFFTKVDAAESDNGKRPAKGKAKAKETGGKQTTLFGLPAVAQADKKAAGAKKKKGAVSDSQTQDSQATIIDSQADETQDSQMTDVAMEETQETQDAEEPTAATAEDDEEPIDWPDSPERGVAALPEVETSA